MNFWIDKYDEITYVQLLSDLREGATRATSPSYNYFLNLLLGLLNKSNINSIEDLISYLKNNSNNLFFDIKTSGTTADPKLISISLSNCIRQVRFNILKSQFRVWGMGYYYESFASTQVFFQALFNLEPIYYIFDLEYRKVPYLLNKHSITNLSCTPTLLSMILVNSEVEVPTILKITTGGERIKNELITKSKKIFVNSEYINIYASTETGSLLYSKNDLFSIPDKYHNQIRIENNNLLVHKSLLNNNNDCSSEDWYNTNDKVKWVGNKTFTFLNRENGYLKTGGYKVYPEIIEDTILEISGIMDVHVYGKSNSILGTIIVADVIAKNVEVIEIKMFLQRKMEKYKIPQVIRLVEKFEHVKNGKKLRHI